MYFNAAGLLTIRYVKTSIRLQQISLHQINLQKRKLVWLQRLPAYNEGTSLPQTHDLINMSGALRYTRQLLSFTQRQVGPSYKED